MPQFTLYGGVKAPVSLGTRRKRCPAAFKIFMRLNSVLVVTLWNVMFALCLNSSKVAFGAETASKSAGAKPAPMKFRPPATGAPSVRVTGGSRGTGDTSVTLDVLAPDDIGLTTQEQPSLFWFQSRPSRAKFELTVLQENKVKPLVQISGEEAGKAGIQRLKLSEHGAKLVPGVEYQWIVALVTDPDNRSTDLIASGVIKRVAPGVELNEKIAQAAPPALAAVYADAGIWYDTLAALSDQIERAPKDNALRQARADLLRQVGLKAAAESEAK